MAERQQTILVYSGILAFGIYFLLLSLFFFNFLAFNKIKYTIKNNTLLEQSISIDFTDFAESKSDENAGTPLEGMGIKDIFSSIPDETATSKTHADNRSQTARNTKEKGDSSKIESLQEQLRKLNKDLQTLQNKTIDIKSTSLSPEATDGQYDEWFAKIYDIIYKKWRVGFHKNAQATILLQVDGNGNFVHKVVRLSQYNDFNQNVLNFLENFKGEKFPPPPNGKAVNIEVNLLTKEQ